MILIPCFLVNLIEHWSGGAVAVMGMGERGWEPGLGGLVGPPTGLEGQRSWDFAFGQIFWAGLQGTGPLGGVCGWG